MVAGLIYMLITLCLLTTLSLCWLIISIKKKSRWGIILSIIPLMFIGYTCSLNYIDELSIDKQDVKKDLAVVQLTLADDFKIIDNKVTGIPERNQETRIKISDLDKKRIISEIGTSTNFKDLQSQEALMNDLQSQNRYSSKQILNYQYPDFFSREIYTEFDNIPTRFSLYLDAKTNILEYKKLED